MSSAAVVEGPPVDRIHELIVAGEPGRAKALWHDIKKNVHGRKNQNCRLGCIRMRLEFVIAQFSRSNDPLDRNSATRLQENLDRFLRA